ncbi:deoxyribodipyrimidine photo-lyase [Nocardia cyriacigeorgica]|uniref:Deoxyribodipyrimidine photo-lyase n=1 Tax=Nocardia cyriacigeorgica TaxID=135487 RepID=A0A6P1DDF5_9NOCA|nr:deoxyribodipyrimidine photo-lyase [Nocardia cyriacigeorgica]NEW40015.1 deoxyribodipyrimidine photo-lyase [Nocardia cyriacigeorgica]NEW46830.1 deoxyribodipyrimidine photo-lyase [Nocardia cyriacigeorgica]NEW53629.1 deoxyribodipyrimidine photo-lyase [Nocardia cyriacigeorgica]NEW58337.1 deoxyribodipyrimidine photo-lyase [Nocardia cyriacigeorgica]
MAVAIALFTRDLRVRDNPALTAAARSAEVLPVFVVDETICASDYLSPNKATFLAATLADLDDQLRRLGGCLLLRGGDTVREVCQLVRQYSVDEVHVAADVSGYSRRREDRLRARLTQLGCRLRVHDSGTTVAAPGHLLPSGGTDHFAVFTPYFRRWSSMGMRAPLPAPRRIHLPDGVGTDRVPTAAELRVGEVSPELAPGGESAGRRAARNWFRDGIAAYSDLHDDLAADATSRLSPYLHFGCLSAVELVHRSDSSSPGGAAFVRQLAWRDFHHQMLAARPSAAHSDYRSRNDRWSDDDALLAAWRAGRTGYPIVDAGMRQLAAQGWMHNRARLITASFLTKTLYVDWRAGAKHFMGLLADGDVANNQLNWQWMAGTGADTRPNRILNPIRQADRYDPEGDYVRRWVPELARLRGSDIHQPWRLTQDATTGYPARIVDHEHAAAEFRTLRQRDSH